MRTLLTLLVVLLPVLACDDGSPTAPAGTPLVVETLAQAQSSGFSAPRRSLVRSQGELAQLWQTLHAGQRPVPAVPVVDFARETAVLVAVGERINGCYGVEVSRAGLTRDGVVHLEVTETVPGPSCGCTQVLTQPVHLIKLALVSDRASYSERTSQLRC